MGFKKVGAAWQKDDKNGDSYLQATLEIDEIEIAEKNNKSVAYFSIRQNKKLKPEQPDYCIYQSVPDKDFLKSKSEVEGTQVPPDDDIPAF